MRGPADRIWSGAEPDEVRADLAPLVSFGEEGRPLDEIRVAVQRRLLPHLVRYDHPGFHALYNFRPEEGAAFGARVALEWNQGVTNWQVSPGGVVLEELLCRRLCRLFQLGEAAGATFLYSGTYANHQALFLALHRRAEERGFSLAEAGLAGFASGRRPVFLASEEAHFSVRQSVRLLGVGEEGVVSVSADGHGRIDPEALGRAWSAEVGEGRDPVAVVLTLGTSSTGALDPLEASLEALEEARGAPPGEHPRPWIHVDGAYGLAFRLLPEFRAHFQELEAADSATWDPHKQFGVPIPSSLLFVRRRADLLRMAVHGDYFNRPDEALPNPGLHSPPSTRPLQALPLALTLLHRGLEGVRADLRRPLEVVSRFAERVARTPDVEVASPPRLGIVCLRLRPEGLDPEAVDALQVHLYRRTAAGGERSISLTRIGGRPVLRFLVVAPTSTPESMLATVEHLRREAEAWRAGGASAGTPEG